MKFPKTLYVSQAPEGTGVDYFAFDDFQGPEQQFTDGETIAVYRLEETKTVHVTRSVTLSEGK